MKNFYFYYFLLTVGVFFVFAQKDPSENENASNDKTKNESDSESTEQQIKKCNRQSFLVTPDERLVLDQKLFGARKSEFLEGYDRILPVRVPAVGERQNVRLTDDSGRYSVQLENFQHERPTYFQAALGSISARIINRKNEEYVPYPPNGDPYNYAAYRGRPQATEPPVIGAYERSSASNSDTPPLVNLNQQNPRRVFANNIYQRSFLESGNLGPDFYPGNFFDNGASDQARNSEKMNKWYGRPRNSYPPADGIF